MKKKIFSGITSFLSFLYSVKLHLFLKNEAITVHSKSVSRLFKSCGKNPHIEYPLVLNGAKFITIGDNFICNARLRLDALIIDGREPKITIGNNVNINFDCHIGAINEIRIGDNVLIASKVFISDHSHGDVGIEQMKIAPLKRPVVSKGPVIINNNVWIGEGASILPNITIGESAIIGTNAVVTKDVPAFAVVGGVPAKIISQNFIP
jgi:acetyltransferase-like isoleucine patch superfamily enzyme